MSMLDEVLGRASLKERIDDLEAETERLRNRLEAESDRRADAVTAKQEAERRVNRLEDRIAQLEGELERSEGGNGDGGSDGPTYRSRERLRGRRLDAVLDTLSSVRTGPEGALTATVADDDLPDAVSETLGDRAALVADAAPCLVCADDAGVVAVALEPPLPSAVSLGGARSSRGTEPGASEAAAEWSDRFALERAWFRPSGRYALALVRADLFAMGVYEDGERVADRGFESDVKGDHSKGGFSQARFERVRDEQIEAHLADCREALADHGADRLYLTGQREAVDALGDADGVDPDATAVVDATGEPKAALEDAARSFWTTRLSVV